MDKVTTKIQRIARMACALGTSVEDGDEAAYSITGALSPGHCPGIIYQDDSCKVVVGLATPAITALIKAPIQANGLPNPVLMVNKDGEIVRCHGEVDALLAHLESLLNNVLLKADTISAMEQAEMQADMIEQLWTDDTIFCHGGCGHWASGLIHEGISPSLDCGWLLAEDGKADTNMEVEALHAFRDGQKLPPGYYKLGPDEAKKIVARGIEKHGIAFVDGTCDLDDLDNVVQEVLLGEVVYG